MFEVASLLAQDSLPPPGPPSLTDGRIDFIKHSTALGTLVLLIYDNLCTFDQEVEHVWLRPRSLGTILFVFNRYLPLISVILVYVGREVYLSAAGCQHLFAAAIWLHLGGISVAQAILYLRTIALWARNRWILWSLGVLYMATVVPSIAFTKIYADSLHYDGNLDHRMGCTLVDSNPIVFLDFVLLLISETTVVILTIIRAYSHLRCSNSSWVYQLYARGFLFYFYLLAFTILNMTFSILAPVPLKTIFTSTQVALHSIFCSRVIFIILGHQTHRADADFDSRPRPTDGIIMSSLLDPYAIGDEFYPSHSRGETRCRENLP